jgi:two-component system, response regulator PdtaR
MAQAWRGKPFAAAGMLNADAQRDVGDHSAARQVPTDEGTIPPIFHCGGMAYPRKAHNAPVVLVVEDCNLSRILTVSAFEDAGFIVMETECGARALTILEANGQYINFLFTDIDMPGAMNGVALAAHCRENWPWIEIAVTSGKATPSASALPERARFFAKPYGAEDVVGHVREVMLAAA